VTAFAGVRVLDCSGGRAGAMAAMHLGDLGAHVVRVDATDDERGRDEPGYLAWHRNKTRVVLDLDDPDERATVRRLIGESDVVIFDSSPDELERRGLDGRTLTGAHERLIHAWAPPYGERGRWSSLPASHHLLAGLTGIAFEQASYDDVPVHLVSPQAHYGQANTLALAIGAALHERDRSGQGQTVVVSGLQGAAQVMIATRWERSTTTLWRAPLGGAPNYRLYQCADGAWLFLGGLFEAVYLRALEVTGVLAEVLTEPEIDGDLRAALVAAGAKITTRLLEAAFRGRSRAEWLALLAAADVPCGPVRSRTEWFHHETVSANGMRVTLSHPELGDVEMPGVSIRMSASPTVGPRLVERAPDPSTPWCETPDAPAVTDPGSGGAPLAGVKILDLGVVIAGAYAGSMLASLGADVVKIEAPHGDPFRAYGTGFAHYNRGKRSLVLDLKQRAALAAFLQLVRESDVVLDNFRLGVRERLGITYEQLRDVNPRIISCSISGYGTEGPQASQPGFDPLLQAQSGLMQAQGGIGSEPVFHGIPVNDVGSAAVAALGIVAALYARSRTGEGQEVHTNLAAQSVLLQSGEVTTHPTAPAPPTGGRDCTGTSAFERYYECTDGWIGIACEQSDRRAALAQALDLGAELTDASASTDRDGPLAQLLAATFATLNVDTALTRLKAAKTPATPALKLEDTYADPFFVENGHYETYVDAEVGSATGCARLARFGRTESGWDGGAPVLGSDTAHILRGLEVARGRSDSPHAEG